MSLPTREASTSASRASNAQVAIRRLQRRLHPLGGKSWLPTPAGGRALARTQKQPPRIDQLTVASGVTGPCVLAVSRDRFTAALVATPGAVIGSTRTLVEVGDNHAGRRSADAAGAVDCAEPIPATLSGPVHRRLTANARP